MKQQLTAVEWLIENIIQLNAARKYGVISWNTYLSKQEELFEQAKEMEKEQIMDAHFEGSEDYRRQYYNETFKQEK